MYTAPDIRVHLQLINAVLVEFHLFCFSLLLAATVTFFISRSTATYHGRDK